MSDNTAENLSPEAEAPTHATRARRSRKHHDAGPEHVAGAVQEVLDQATRQPGDEADMDPSHAGAVGKKQYKPAPDPFGGHLITLSSDGLKGRLLRDKQYGKMLIQFSKNPGKEFTDQIAEEGFQWKPHAHTDFAKGAWVLSLTEGQEWRGHAHAESVFQKVINQIREQNGMEPWIPGAGQAPAF